MAKSNRNWCWELCLASFVAMVGAIACSCDGVRAPTPHSPSSTIVEATGWVTNDKGEVVLTATAPTTTFDIPWLPESGCHVPKTSSN